MKLYTALIVDLKDSKKMGTVDRIKAQERLNDVSYIINMLYDKTLERKIGIIAGDSIQWLFKAPLYAYAAYTLIINLMYPYEVKGGIGIGNIDNEMFTLFNHNQETNVIDGEAYHNARNALEYCKKNNLLIYFVGDFYYYKTINTLVNESFSALSTKPRKILFSIISIIDPIVTNFCDINEYYFNHVMPIVTDLVNDYKLFSVENRKGLTKNESTSYKPYHVNEIEKIFHPYITALIDEVTVFIDWDSSKNWKKSTLTTSVRELLAQLLGTSDQNISSLINKSNMDYIRKSYLARLEVIDILCGGILK